jgi:predicted permease
LREELLELYRRRVGEKGQRSANAWLLRQLLAFVPLFVARTLWRPVALAVYAVAGVAASTRALRRNPTFAWASVLTLAFGVGSTALILMLVDGVLLRALPFREPERLVAVWEWVSRGEVSVIRRESRSLEEVRMYQDVWLGINLELGGSAERVEFSFLEPGLLELLGTRPILGRAFTAEEGDPGTAGVTILSEGLWRGAFGADPAILGRELVLDGHAYEVVGVLPRSWRFPSHHDQLWLPLEWNPTQPGPFWGFGGFRAVARLSPGTTAEEAERELGALAPEIARSNPVWSPDPDSYRSESRVVGLQASIVGEARPTLLLLLLAAALMLASVVANVSSLLAARALERRGSLGVRAALGASRLRLAGEALAESLALGVAGTLLGAICAGAALELLRPTLALHLARSAEIALDPRALSITAGLGVAVSLLAGAPTAVRAGASPPSATLATLSRGGVAGIGTRRTARLLVAGQIAAAVVLVTSAGLLVRTMAAIGHVEPGFRTDDVVTAVVTLPSSLEASAEGVYAALLERAGGLGGVRRAALAASLPFGVTSESYATAIEGVTLDPNDLPVIDVDRVSPSYFDVLAIPLRAGRVFTPADRAGSPLVAVVDELMAREYWPSESPVGRRVRFPWAGAPWIEVVGVVGSVADDRLTEGREPRWYVPLAQRPAPNVTLLVAADGESEGLTAGLADVVGQVDPRVPLSRVMPYDDLLGEAAARERLTTWLVALFAGSALLLGCLGVYGVASCSVRERSREIGVRLALGAERASVGAGVLREGLRIAAPGALVGLLAAGLAARLLEGLLYGVQPLDPATFIGVPVIVGGAALLSLSLPALRAACLDPVEAIRRD